MDGEYCCLAVCKKMVEELMGTKAGVAFRNEHQMHASTVLGAIMCGGLLAAERLHIEVGKNVGTLKAVECYRSS